MKTEKLVARSWALIDVAPFSAKGASEWLSGNIESENPALDSYRRLPNGPAQSLKWKVMAGDSHCFVSNVTSVKKPKKKIIFANALFKREVLTDIFFCTSGNFLLKSRLIAEHDCYFWEGSGMNLSSSAPIIDANEFFANQKRIRPATEADIRKYLEQNHLPADEYRILDYSAEQQRWETSRNTLDLSKIPLKTPEDLAEILASVEPNEITRVCLTAPTAETLKFLQDNFPNITSLDIRKIPPNWVTYHQDFVKEYKKSEYEHDRIEVRWQRATVNTATPPQAPQLGRISITRPFTIKSLAEYKEFVDSGQSLKVEELNINSDVPIPIDGKDFPKLKWLGYDCKNGDNVVLSGFPALEFCTLACAKSSVSIEKCPKLFYVRSFDDKEIRFNSQLPALKYLMIENLDSDMLQYLPELEFLKGNFVGDSKINLGDNIKYLDFSQDVTHKELTIETGKGLKILKYREHRYDPQKKTALNVKNSAELRSISITRAQSKKPAPVNCIKINGLSHCSNLLLVSGGLDKSEVGDLKQVGNCSHITDLSQLPQVQGSPDRVFESKSPGFSETPPQSQEQKSQEQKGMSFFSLETRISPDAPTGKGATFSGKGKFKTALTKNGEPLSIDTYRIFSFDHIAYQNDDRISFEISPLSISKEKFIPIKELSDTSVFPTDQVHGLFEGELEEGKDYPLPTLGPIEEKNLQIYRDPTTKVEVGYYYNSARQQSYLRLLKPAGFFKSDQPEKIKLFYSFLSDPNYQSTQYTPAKSTKYFPDALRKRLEKELAGDTELKFLFDEKLPLIKKIESLQIFCAAFKDEKQQSKVKTGTVAQLLAIIKERRGVCRHSAEVFMLLGRMIGADVRLIRNENHEYCEIMTENGKLVRIDLGGGNQVKDAPGVNRDILKEFKTLAPLQKAPVNLYEAKIRASLTQRHAFDWKMFTNIQKPALIYLPAGMSADEARDKFLHRDTIPQPYVYIDNPSDFNRYLQTYKLQNGRRVTMPGPLQQILNEGGTILIDWSKFQPAERIHYQSLWAAKSPRLNEYAVEKPIKIIGFLPEQTPCPPGFNCRECTLPNLEYKIPVKPILLNFQKAITVDLYQSADWFEQLVADLTFSQTGATQVNKPLLHAIKARQPLIIHRPPADPEFDQLIKQIQIEGRFLFNGQWVQVPPEVSIEISNQPAPKTHHTSSVEPVELINANAECKGQKIYLHRNNWYTLYEETRYEKTNGFSIPLTQPGKLQKNREKPVTFYVTEQISAIEWERLTDFIHKKCPGTTYTFQLAPGVDGVHEFIESKKTSLSYFSNDPAYATEKLWAACYELKEDPAIIDLTPDMDATDLLGKIVLDEKSPDGLPRFTVEERALLTALQAQPGRTVILKGALSPALLQILLPLFSDDPYLEFNSERVKITGRVILVQPEMPEAERPSILRHQNYHFTDADYRADLLKKPLPEGASSEERENAVDKLLLFFKAADYPHRGRTMPADLGKLGQSLARMLQVLLTKSNDSSHRHNPIKGLKLFNYEKTGEYYAFLNVLSKFLFDTSTGTPVRIQKFQKLQQKIDDSKNHSQHFAWRLLNTCDGATLRKILGEAWLENIINGQQNPDELRAQVVGSHWQKIFENLKSTLEQFQPEPIETSTSEAKSPQEISSNIKLKQRLQYLIEKDPAAKVIVIKGDPGVGKTHYLNELKTNPDYRCYNLMNIDEWLTDESPGIKLLLLDEANTYAEGTLDFLDGLTRNPPVIFHQGRWHPLTAQHKIVAAVNPESFSGRYYHNFLRHGNTELAKMPGPEFLAACLIRDYQVESVVAKHILAAADLFRTYQPLTGYSFRNLQSAAQRFNALSSEMHEAKAPEILYDTLYGEFGLAIPNTDLRQQFKTQLAEILELKTELPEKSAQDKLFRVNDKLYAAELADGRTALYQALLIRQNVKKNHQESKEQESPLQAYKRGVILQGGAGIGKFDLSESVLQQMGLQPGSDYFVVSAGEESFRKIAQQAFDQGAVLVIKNFNLIKPADERYLGALLTGIDEKGRPAKNPGFMVIGLRNPHSEAGVNALSPALCNRMQIVHLPAYSDASWCALAEKRLGSAEKAQKFVQAIWHPVQAYSRRMTGHDFFEYLDDFSKDEETTYKKIQFMDSIKDCQGAADTILAIEKFLSEHNLVSPTPLAAHKPTYIMALCLYRLIMKKDKLQKQYGSYQELTSKPLTNLFVPFSGREMSIKKKKINGLDDLIYSIITRLPQKAEADSGKALNLPEIVKEVRARHPDLTAGNINQGTESVISNILKFYDSTQRKDQPQIISTKVSA